MKGQIWETRPLEFWAKAKELRAGWQNAMGESPKVIGQGNAFWCNWQEAFPSIMMFEDNPAGAMIQSKSSPFARKCRLACEARGWGREICGYQGTLWGTQFLGYDLDGRFPERQFVVPFPAVCDLHTKRGVYCRDYAPVPQWSSDFCIYLGPRDEAREEAMLEHKAYCDFRIMNDMERIFGQKFDDEKLVEMIHAQNTIHAYAFEISMCMAKYTPSPLSVKDLYSVYAIGGLTKIDPQETLDFWKLVRDEVKWRSENQIAAVGNERFRWVEAHPPSWHYLKYYRYMEKFGAICLGSQYAHMMSGGFGYAEDGKTILENQELLVEGVEPYPEDMPIVTREDAVRYMFGTDARAPYAFPVDEYLRPKQIISIARIMQADGAILPLWRHGVGCTLTRKEQAMYMRNAGLSVMHYEGSQPGDRTDLDEKRFIDQLDSWMESLGLQKLEN
jgi:benzoyl-CoA reductase subunit B